MHICKLSRRKIARECIFCAGVPAYACMKAGAAALKSHCASNIFLRNGVPDKTCTCNVLVGRSEGRRRFYAATRHPLRPPCRTRSPALLHCTFGGNPPAGKGRAEVRKNNRQFLSTCRLNAVKCHINVISIRKKCVYTQKMQIEFAYIKKKLYLCTRKKCVYTQKMQIA